MMETIALFGIVWVVFAVLIVIFNDRRATLARLALNLTIAAFLLTESDLTGALTKATLGIASPAIILVALARTRQPQRKFGVPLLMVVSLVTLALSYAVAFSLRSQFPEGRMTESYFLIMLFGIAFLVIVSQESLMKLLLGILMLEDIGTLLLGWGANAALFALVEEAFIVLITFTIAFIAVKSFAEYGTIDTSKMTRLRG
jgi:Co/Zn/Cd efflux system component